MALKETFSPASFSSLPVAAPIPPGLTRAESEELNWDLDLSLSSIKLYYNLIVSVLFLGIFCFCLFGGYMSAILATFYVGRGQSPKCPDASDLGCKKSQNDSLGCPDQRGSVGWAWSCKANDCGFNSQSGHMRGLQVIGLVPSWGTCERQLIDISLFHRRFFPSLSPSLPLSLKINKSLKKIIV